MGIKILLYIQQEKIAITIRNFVTGWLIMRKESKELLKYYAKEVKLVDYFSKNDCFKNNLA